MKRVYESGHKKRKLKEEREESLKKLPKITGFLKVKENKIDSENLNNAVRFL